MSVSFSEIVKLLIKAREADEKLFLAQQEVYRIKEQLNDHLEKVMASYVAGDLPTK